MTRPAVEALERAFASCRGLTPADARFVADDAFGILARELELDDALFLQQSLGSEGVEVQVVPESDLPRLPDAKLFSVIECLDSALVIYDPLERPTSIQWDEVTIIAAGYDQREFMLELLVGDAEFRFSSTVDRLLFNRMPQYTEPTEPDNVGARYSNLVRDLVGRCPRALPNRAAYVLAQENAAGDVTEAITYPRTMAYVEELTWLMWRIRSAV